MKRGGFKSKAPGDKPKLKTCRAKDCYARFEPAQPWVTWCSPECGAVIGLAKLGKQKAKQASVERKTDKQRKQDSEPLQYWVARAEKACNAYIRERDANLPCISCGRSNAEVWNAGHYVSVGSNRTLRFIEDNIHKQCARPCNMDLAGNLIKYRQGLLLKIGVERLEWLEGWHDPIKMTREKAQEIEIMYKAKIKQLKGQS